MVRPVTCPICHKPVQASKTLPFCSERCRTVDFFRWNDGRYAIVEPLDPNRIEEEILKAAESEAEEYSEE